MLLADLVATANEIAAVGSRNTKIELLADLLKRCDREEVPIAVGLLSGKLRQGKIGVGWARLSSLDIAHARSSSISISELDKVFSAIQATVGSGSVLARAEIISTLFERATESEADFIRRALIGELRHGALAGVMAEGIAKASGLPASEVRRAAMLSGDLGLTAVVALHDGRAGLKKIGLRIFTPILPMLAATSENIEEALTQTGRASVEWKLDGIRVQVHRLGDDVRVFTRNLNDITDRVPDIPRAVLKLKPERLVLDGEAIAFDASERPFLFQETMSSIGRETVETRVFFFDCLHLEGNDLIDMPLSERVEALAGFAQSLRIPAEVTDDAARAESVLAASIAAGHEGVMVKSLDSLYQAGRRGRLWRKVKPIKTLDLVVLGAEWGHGRRRGWLSNLHLGARGSAREFVMVGKTFKGLTDEILRWQTDRLLKLETHREGITVFVRPELVVEIELDGVQQSTRYPGGVALRFARVKTYRGDKSPAEADTIDTVRGLLL